MRIAVVGQKKNEIEPLLEQSGYTVAPHPEFVVSYGGDGTLLQAEYLFPGIPKIVLRASRVCKQCSHLSNDEVLSRVREGSFSIQEIAKLTISCGEQSMEAINDIVVHNADPRHAIRYRITIDGVPLGGEIIGDGIVVATPFGSTGYYRSITDSSFQVGIGLAFNNSTEQSDHVVLREEAIIALSLLRGPATVYADNQERFLEINAGETAHVRTSANVARLVRV